MQPHSQRHYTVEEYFSVEQSSQIRHEYFNGQIFAMAGASMNHNRIVRNILSILQRGLRESPCEPFASDMRIITPSGLYTYPDILVVCKEYQFSSDPLETLINPILLVEVLSDSTREYDRNEKFNHYRTIPSMKDYLLIEQTSILVEHWQKKNSGEWEAILLGSTEENLTISGIQIQLKEIYDRVDFPAR